VIHEIDPEDAVLRAALAQVRPLNRHEWLRDRLAAGLCGVDVPLDGAQAHRVPTPPRRSSAQDTPPLDRLPTPASSMVEVWTDDAEEIPSAVIIEHEAGPTQGHQAIEKDDADCDPVGDDGEPKLNDFARLFA